jgi:hypothetical protein
MIEYKSNGMPRNSLRGGEVGALNIGDAEAKQKTMV